VLQRYAQAPDSTKPALSVQGAAHSYGARRALDGVSLTVAPGQIYSLLGPNGAGKSTLLRAIAGRLRLDHGRMRVAGNLSASQAASRHLIGYVPQDIALYRHLTVRENLEFFSRMFGQSGRRAEESVARTLGRAALQDRANQITGTLSGGYQRRVNIAVAALNDPYLLVLDEPTVGIDVQAREQIHALLRVLQDGGAAIVLTTHDLEQAEALSDRVGILDRGRMRLEGEPETLLRDAFGVKKELIVALQKPADEREAGILRSLRLRPQQQQASWSNEMPPARINVAQLTSFLGKHGIDVQEIRVRKPDLSSLFLKTLGEDRPQ
jgi:ABC-2 type transport system ATP-binding protein